jgi:ABC-type branched-subunit amino acid transport system substrate-binding protein
MHCVFERHRAMMIVENSSTREPGRLTAKTWAVRIATATLVLGLSSHQAQAQLRISNDTVKLGVLTDMSSIYTDNSGPGSVAAAQMAVADFGGTVLGKRIEVVSADNLNKADVGASVTREWIDRDGASCSATRALSLTPRLTADNKNSRTPARLAAKADVRIEL